MIKVNVTKKDDIIVNVTIKGHANYSEQGSDIVCSAVSAIGVGTLNAVHKIAKIILKPKIEEGLLVIDFPDDGTCQIIAKTMVVQLKTIEEERKKYIKIENKKL